MVSRPKGLWDYRSADRIGAQHLRPQISQRRPKREESRQLIIPICTAVCGTFLSQVATVEMCALMAIVGLVGGLLAGWVGLGGGITLAPLLLFIPPAVGLDPLDMKEVARLTIIQSLCSTAAAGIAHRRARLVHGPLVVWMGAIIAMASLSGGTRIGGRRDIVEDAARPVRGHGVGGFAAHAASASELRRP